MVRLSVYSSLFLSFTRRSASVIGPKNPARWTMQSQPSSHFTTKSSQSRSSNDDLLAITRDQPDPFLQVGLRRESMPRHVAVILDGNRRWADAHGKELDYGPFCQGQLNLTDPCIKWGVAALSCFIFSTENWKRSKEANDNLLGQFQRYLEEGLEDFARKGIKVTVIGEKPRLPKPLQEVIKQVEEGTKNNSILELNLAVSYGGKWDIVQAIRRITQKAMAGEIKLENIDEALVNEHLLTHGLRHPYPDLMIRTGGDQRVSNFLVWQLSHAEFYFTNVYGPDFGEPHFIDALRWFQQCDRRFGK